MSTKKQQQTIRQQQRTTTIVAIATFLGLSLITLVAWSLTRKQDASAAPSQPVAEAGMMAAAVPTQAPPAAEDFTRISAQDLKKAIDANQVAVLDVRTLEQYEASHIPGAMQIPVPRVEGEIPYLPKDKPIVTYCTCPNEESSGEAAMILARGGIRAMALHGGLGAWVELGYPTATGLK